MPYLQGSVVVDNIPRNNATVNLYDASTLASAPSGGSAAEGGTPPPAAGILQTTQSGLQHGGEGAYRFLAGSGQYWVGVAWNGYYAWEYFNISAAAQRAISILDYGADPLGLADSTSALRQAFAAVPASGAAVYAPAGVYSINPSGMNWIALPSNLDFYGDGPATVLRVNAAAGSYEAIFSGVHASSYVHDVRIHDLAIDQNCANVSATVSSTTGHLHYCVKLFNFDRITIERVNFDPIDGVNTVSLNSGAGTEGSVRNCRFHWLPSGGTATYDNSALYFDCQNHSAVGNVFTAEPSGNARGAIESHNGRSVISGNRSVGYRTFVNIVSSTGTNTGLGNDINVVGNMASRCCQAITIWPLTSHPLTDVNIVGNVLDLSQVDHNQTTNWGIAFADDAVNGTVSGSTTNLLIANNNISFQTEVLAGRVALTANLNCGINVGKAGPLTNCQVLSNLINQASIRGIIIGHSGRKNNPIRGLRVVGNTLVDCGAASGFVADGNRICLSIEGTDVQGVQIHDNFLIDTGVSALNGSTAYFAATTSLTGSAIWIDTEPQWSLSGLKLADNIGGTAPVNKSKLFGALAVDKTVRASGHVFFDGNTPTYTAGTGAGTSPTIAVSGTDQSGVINLLTGTGCSGSATVLTVTFAAAFETLPRGVILTPANSNTTLLTGASQVHVDVTSISVTHFAISVGSTHLSDAASYIWFYSVLG